MSALLRRLRARRRPAGGKVAGGGDGAAAAVTSAVTTGGAGSSSSEAEAEAEAEAETAVGGAKWPQAEACDAGRAPVGMAGVPGAEDGAPAELRGSAEVRAAGGSNSPALYPSAAALSALGGKVAAGVDLDDPAAVCPRPGADGRLNDTLLWAQEDVREEEEEVMEETAGAGEVASRAEPRAAVPRALPRALELAVATEELPPPNVGFVKTRMDRVKQTMRGFGFSNAFWTHVWDSHKHRDRIYHALFAGLQPAIIRLRNVHDHTEVNPVDFSEVVMDADVRFVDGAQYHLGYRPEILLTSWTPPAYLKANEDLMGGGDEATLKKNDKGWFMYKEFAQWWVDSLNVYADRRLMPTYMSTYR